MAQRLEARMKHRGLVWKDQACPSGREYMQGWMTIRPSTSDERPNTGDLCQQDLDHSGKKAVTASNHVMAFHSKSCLKPVQFCTMHGLLFMPSKQMLTSTCRCKLCWSGLLSCQCLALQQLCCMQKLVSATACSNKIFCWKLQEEWVNH